MSGVTVGSWALDERAGELRRGTERMSLTRLERDLLAYLVSRQGSTVSRSELLRHAWTRASRAEDRAELLLALTLHDQAIGPVDRMKAALLALPLDELSPAVAQRVQLQRAALAFTSATLTESLAFARDALARARAVGDPTSIVRAWREVAQLERRTEGSAVGLAAWSALQAYVSQPEVAARVPPREIALVLHGIADAELHAGRPAEACELLQRGLALLAPGDLEPRATLVKSLGEVLSQLGRSREALALLAEEVRSAEPYVGSRVSVLLKVELCACMIDHGQTHEARERLPAVIEEARAGGYWAIETIAKLNLAATTEDLFRAEQLCIEASERARRMGRRELVSHAEGNVAMIRHSRGEFERARQAYRRAIDVLRDEHLRRPHLRMLDALAQAAAGDREGAHATLCGLAPSAKPYQDALEIARRALAGEWDRWRALRAGDEPRPSAVLMAFKLTAMLPGAPTVED